jgi:serine protease Do
MIRTTLDRSKRATFALSAPDKKRHGFPTPLGTAFMISQEGVLLTAAHVIRAAVEERGAELGDCVLESEVRFEKGSFVRRACYGGIELLRMHPNYDLAILKASWDKNRQQSWLASRKGFPFLKVSARSLEEGEPVYSVGYPLSEATVVEGPAVMGNVTFGGPGVVVGFSHLCPRVTSAIVASTVHFTGPMATDAPPVSYVLDKALNYGNSGGPIISVSTGNVYGVCREFQPVIIPQPHLKNSGGEKMEIMIPSLYGVASSLAVAEVLSSLREFGVPIAG